MVCERNGSIMKSRGRRLVVIVVLGGALLAGVGAFLRQFVTPVLVVGPMLQRVGANSATVVWRTAVDRPGHVVLLNEGKARLVPAVIENGWHIARIDRLEPDKAYRYVVRHERAIGSPQELASATVHTAPSPGQPVQFLVFGDSGSGSNSQANLAARMREHTFDFAIHTGDLIYPAGEPELYADRFFRPYAAMIRTVPFYPILGNHDVKTDDGQPLLDTFVLPENGPEGLEPERCYWFEFGDVRIVGIDSTLEWDPLRETVAPWLRRVLSESRRTWTIAFFHHPPYTNSKHDPDRKMRETLVPALEEGGVDVVFCGHNHLFERTKPIRDGQVVPIGEGIVYVISGAGGASKYAERDTAVDYIAAYNHDTFSFTVATITGATLRLRQIDIRGEVIDDWSYTRSAPTKP